MYSRVHELQQCALRGLDTFRLVTKEEAQEAIKQYKKKNPKKSKPRKKVNKFKINLVKIYLEWHSVNVTKGQQLNFHFQGPQGRRR